MSNNIDLYIQEIEISKADIKGAIQSKGVTPTGGLSSYAEAILSIPTGTPMAPLNETITENGVYNYNPIDDGVGGYSSVEINVDIDVPTFETQSKEVTIKKNGTTSIVPDSGYDGLSSVEVTVQVSTGGSDKPQILNGFRFTGGDIAQVDFSQYDWSMVYDTSYFFQGCTHSTGDWSNFLENFNGDVLSLSYTFAGKTSSPYEGVKTLPNLGNKTADITSAAYMCYYNRNLDDVSALSQWNTSKVVDASYMFGSNQNQSSYNPKITTIDLTNFGSPDGYEADYMFRGCGYLESITGTLHPVGSASYMFANCSKLTSIPQLDTSNVTSMNAMFYDCRALTSVPQMDVSNVTDFYTAFNNCSSLVELPDINSVKAKSFGRWLQGCNNLQKLGVVDCDSATNVGDFFLYSSLNSLTEIGGWRNLGKASSVSGTNGSYFMALLPNLTYESVMNVINGLYDRASAGLSVLTLKLHANHLTMLSEDDIVIATNKGWTIV